MQVHTTTLARATRFIGALVPISIACFILYWLEYGQVWSQETPHRGKISVVILGSGLLLSFYLHSLLNRK